MASPSLKRGAGHLSTPAADAKKSKANGSITSFFGAPKSSPTATATTKTAAPSRVSSSFNKQKWVATLTAEQKELLQLEIDTMDESWLAHLKEEIVKPEFLALKRFLQKEKQSATVFPPEEDIYSWSRHTPLHSVKVVIIGQDPYHNYNQAHGLAFSVRPPTPAPPSLVNIYRGITNDYPSFQIPPNKGGLLTPWAERGVLLLNTSLTVRAHQAASHSNKGWERLTQKAIDIVTRVRTRGVVFMAWGAHAGKRVTGINSDKHCILQSVHPSPLSVHKGFLQNQHFKKCNEWLAERYGSDGVIDWSLTAAKEKTSTAPLAVVQSSSVVVNKSTASPSQDGSRTVTESTKEMLVATKANTSTQDDDEFDEDLDALEALAAATDESSSES
ncbi:uracil-DNA glycosylase-like protein [Aspergillus pseudodeflectus]|uniref:Uracil-DNA glycosylase n=1 Tax=Aspergillus pseudodeflectus TaxID=176178 RepID=A0ABR4JMC0_9EURO